MAQAADEIGSKCTEAVVKHEENLREFKSQVLALPGDVRMNETRRTCYLSAAQWHLRG